MNHAWRLYALMVLCVSTNAIGQVILSTSSVSNDLTGCWEQREVDPKTGKSRYSELCFEKGNRVTMTFFADLMGENRDGDWMIKDQNELYIEDERCVIDNVTNESLGLKECDFSGRWQRVLSSN